jgi:hypothetical protein
MDAPVTAVSFWTELVVVEYGGKNKLHDERLLQAPLG